ncbi:centrosome-associated protein 350 isoform X1 [Salmo salar]|uniref:Centrosome-associated protein 350-like isoform X1 n=2 Tax=Salmo salar TaxID=8030 RepID=A0A1S3PBF8_SALSA|nr:centrosome-associated protein 350-like isoform X1 [Salmo salar]XP_014024906.2 centrosome-associated protein 350-like isoform X1 [Salmo salar]
MWSSKRNEPSLTAPAQTTGQDNRRELSAAWKSLNQTKAAHIENRQEAAPGSGVLLDSVMDTKKSSGGATRKVSRRGEAHNDGRRTEDCSQAGGTSKSRRRSHRSPDKSSRSPLRNTTQDSNVHRNNCVEFKEPLTSYREATPTPPLTSSQLEAHSLQSEVATPPPPDSCLSQLVYQSDTRDQQTRGDLDSTHSSALDSTVVRYLNHRPMLEALRPRGHAATARNANKEGGPEDRAHTLEGPAPPPAETVSSSPGSASQRLENLRRRKPDDKLEKLKETIRRQREHLEAADRDGLLEQPVGISGAVETTTIPTAKIRKVAAAPPAPIYKGFNRSETKICTPDGKVWREIYRDLSRQLSESTKPKQRPTEKAKERKPSKPVRKIHKSASVPDPETKLVISTTSWREGQKLVKMVLGTAPRLPQEQRPEPTDRLARTASHPRSNSEPCPELNCRSRPSSSERPCSRDRTTQPTPDPFSAGPAEDRALNTDLLSVDIQGILDDLQLEHRAEERAPVEPRTGSVSGARTTAWTAGCSSLRGSRSASPAKRNKPEPSEPGPKKRHYDADSVRQYITRQQEERKRRLVEERRAQREEAESRSQRLQELYRKQRAGVANKGPAVLESPVQKRLQETYTKLLLEQAELEQEPLPDQTQPASTTVIHQQRPLYQPSGESDKENKRQERPQSASSSSDLSPSELQPPPLSRNELGLGVPSWLQPDRLSPAVRPSSALAPPTDDKLFSLGLETGGDSGVRGTRPQHSTGAANKTKMNRIEAMKATAASLSTHIESEARKLAGAGINYGCAKDMDLTGLTHLQPQDDGCWAKPVSPSVRESADAADELSLRIQRLLSAGQSAYNGALPGVGNLHSFREQRGGASASGSRPHTSPGLGSHKRPEEHPEAPWKTKLHDSSGDSISEGPLLSEGSLSEGNESPRTPIKRVPKPAERLGSLDFCAGQREGFQPISHFQRAAEKYPALSTLPFSQTRDRSRGPWEELTKGSPHSVINIFTKNHLHNHTKVGGEERADRSSPAVRCGLSAASSVDVAPVYEDDFVSSRSSGGGSSLSKKGYNGCSITSGNSHYDELMSRRSPYDTRTIDLPSHHSSGSTPVSSPHSKGSVKKGAASDKSDATLVEEQRSPCSPGSESLSRDSRRGGSASERSSIHSLVKSVYTDSTLGGASGYLHCSLGLDSKKSPRSPSPSPAGSPTDSSSPRVSPGSASLAGADILGLGSGCPHSSARPSSSSSLSATLGGRAEPTAAGELHYTPGGLQQHMSAELHYLESIEESVRQLGDVERLRGVSLAQQESVSLAQILKAQQQRHERDLHELKVKAEQEALETQWQLEETRQKAARAHVELQEDMAQTQQQSLGGMQEATAKMISQPAESVRYTAVASHQFKEMTELACCQIGDPAAAPISTLFDQQRQHHQSFMGDMSAAKNRTEEPFSLDSRSDSTPSRRPNISGGESSHRSPSLASSEKRQRRKVETGNSSVVEAVAHTAAEDSIPSDSVQSLLDEKDSASVATEYSLKFDESMTEDEIEERSFRSLLPSESHRRGVLEKKRVPHEESDDEPSQENPTAQDSSKQDGSMPFSSGQDSFSRFTMDMVRQYMKEEEVRAHHQSSLLRLRQKALKEKTKAELAWLEHQKRRLRDKGEDDKMPPIRKKQRGLLMKLQQEQAEIKRLQEANRAARKERQLLLKQQEEIERMRYTTLKLKERLKCAGTGDTPPETPVSEHVEGATSPSAAMTDGDVRSASPLSVSGSETSSIMQKLKKMRSHTDKKFLTKREQGLMHRRRHAEELLEWKQRLDAEEAEVRRMEKQALAAWDRERPRDGDQRSDHRDYASSGPNASSGQHDPEGKTDRDSVSEGDYSPVVTGSSVHTDLSGSQQPDIPSTDQPGSVSELPSTQHSPSIYTQDLDSPSVSKRSPSPKASLSTNTHPEGSSSKMQLCSSSRTSSHDPKAADTPSSTHTEPMSDQSDIESRIRALKEELRKRKSVVYQLKKEQKKRHKERLKAQEASLLKQLESYNDFIEKTETELNKEPDSTPAAKPQIKAPTSATEKPKIKPPPPYRPETGINWTVVSDSEKAEKTLPHSPVEQDDLTTSGLSKYSAWHEESSDEDPPTVTPTPVYGSPEHTNGLRGLLSPEPLPRQPSEGALPLREPARPQATDSGDERVVSSHRSEVMEELDSVKSEGSEHTQSLSEDRHFDHLLKLDLGHSPASQQHHSLSEHVSSEKGEQGISLISSLDVDEKSAKSPSPIKERSYTPESDVLSSKGDFSAKGKDASPPSADGYHEDFGVSVESSLREDNQGSKPTSPSRQETREASHSRSPFCSSEEEIGEELSGRSGATGGSPRSERLLDLQSQTKDSQVISSNRSPTISPSQTLPSPALDEMPNFTIGDRVLVSNVQPGTLRFKGHTSFANGFWAGVELDKSEGSNNGTYDGVVYFECEDDHGIFAPPDKISCMPEKFEIDVDTTEDEDSFLDDQSENEPKKCNFEEKMHESSLQNKRGGVSQSYRSGDNGPTDVNDDSAEHQTNLINLHEFKEGEYSMSNERTKTIILDFEDVPTSLFITDIDRKITIDETSTIIESNGLDAHQKSTPEQTVGKDTLSAFADKLLNNFMKDAVKQFAQIKKAKEEKISAVNQMKDDLFNEEGRETVSQAHVVAQRDGLPFFLDGDQEEQVSSPELCNRPESPVLGASGQEELTKRLAELELNRELLDELGDEQDWFDEDYGLSSRREQQKRKQQQEGGLSVSLADQVKTPPRPELPRQPKLPEQPAMVVPHSAPKVEKLVDTATQEIWNQCKLGQGTQTLTGLPVPKPSEEFLGCDGEGKDQESQCVRSYRQAVYDLTWEIIQEIFAEDPNAHQPQWVKPRRMNSSYFHRVKSPGDITRVQAFITTEVLKLYSLKKDLNQKTDWQKMLKFGRKKRDRVDHILVQELHEEESQWVNYDEDELYVKMQLADGIFDALIKDTAEVLTQIQEKRLKRALS